MYLSRRITFKNWKSQTRKSLKMNLLSTPTLTLPPPLSSIQLQSILRLSELQRLRLTKIQQLAIRIRCCLTKNSKITSITVRSTFSVQEIKVGIGKGRERERKSWLWIWEMRSITTNKRFFQILVVIISIRMQVICRLPMRR